MQDQARWPLCAGARCGPQGRRAQEAVTLGLQRAAHPACGKGLREWMAPPAANQQRGAQSRLPPLHWLSVYLVSASPVCSLCACCLQFLFVLIFGIVVYFREEIWAFSNGEQCVMSIP